MNVLIIGSGQGSWAMRGVQLGAALGARVTSTPVSADYAWADLIVLVKRAIYAHRDHAVRTGKPVIWDALDFWQQPSQNSLSQVPAVAAARHAAGEGVRLIGATQAMAAALGGTYLPHHCWHGLTPTPARREVRTVAYQGGAVYLGRWAAWLSEACMSRGWRFVVNPPDLSTADIIVSFRDGEWDGWICREWKSGVKVVNAIAAGRPLIGQDCAARRESIHFGSVVESVDQLGVALDYWADYHERAIVVEWATTRATRVTVEAIAAQYRTVLEGHACPA